MNQEMVNCYSDLEKILKHYGYSFDDVVVENVYTTDMADFIKNAGYRMGFIRNNFQQVPGSKLKALRFRAS
jgi:2-iminobutanoate/2-iminopropanoate deaminase